MFKNSRAERIENIRRFAMKTASYVVLEWHRAEPRNIVSTDEAVDRAAPQADLHEDDLDRGVLRLCLQQLAPTDRDLIVRFYAEGKNKDNRRDLANQLHISLEALHTRACRVIKDLRECFATRLASKRGRS